VITTGDISLARIYSTGKVPPQRKIHKRPVKKSFRDINSSLAYQIQPLTCHVGLLSARGIPGTGCYYSNCQIKTAKIVPQKPLGIKKLRELR